MDEAAVWNWNGLSIFHSQSLRKQGLAYSRLSSAVPVSVLVTDSVSAAIEHVFCAAHEALTDAMFNVIT